MIARKVVDTMPMIYEVLPPWINYVHSSHVINANNTANIDSFKVQTKDSLTVLKWYMPAFTLVDTFEIEYKITGSGTGKVGLNADVPSFLPDYFQ